MPAAPLVTTAVRVPDAQAITIARSWPAPA